MANDPRLLELFNSLNWATALDSRDTEKVRAKIAELLRGDGEIPREARDRLADMLDQKDLSLHVLEVKKRRGCPKGKKHGDADIFLFVDELTQRGVKKEAAVDEAMKHFDLSRAAVFASLKKSEDKIKSNPENQRRLEQIRKSRKIG
jgi:hypothetical protein